MDLYCANIPYIKRYIARTSPGYDTFVLPQTKCKDMSNVKIILNGKELESANFLPDYMDAIQKAVLNSALNHVEKFRSEIDNSGGKVEIIVTDPNQITYRFTDVPEELRKKIIS
jgi:hypothetical protein